MALRFSLRKTAILLIVLALLLGGGWYVIVRSVWLPRFLVQKYLKEKLPDMVMEEFAYQSRSVRFPDQFQIEGVKLVLKKKQERFEFKIGGLKVVSLTPVWQPVRHLQVSCANFAGHWGESSWDSLAADADVYQEKAGLFHLQGRVNLAQFQYGNYKLKEIRSPVEGNSRQIRFSEVVASAYGGNLRGQILLEYVPRLTYSINLDLEKVNLVLLRSVNPQVFSQLEGLMDGRVALEIDSLGINKISGNIQIPQGGQVKAVWLKPLVEYIPASAQRNELENLIAKNSNLPIQEASIEFASISKESLKTVVNLKSHLLYLADSPLDLNVEGGLMQLLLPMKLLSQ